MLNWFSREPLAGFLLAGTMLFGIYWIAETDERPEIEVSAAVIDSLVSERQLVLERPLTAAEITALRENFIDQEVLVREAMARRLYLNDGQIRHRLADKMLYLLAEEPETPTKAELEAFYTSRRHLYRTPELISFTHFFYAADRSRAEAARSEVVQVGASRAGTEVDPAADADADADAAAEVGPADRGEPFWMGGELERYSINELLPIFGAEFTRELGELEPGSWSGPMQSSRGWHLVRVSRIHPQQDIPREELNLRLEMDWRGERLADSRRRSLDELRNGYRIVESIDAGDG